eukprot:357461-Chlamydomonas_euryale.AAC.2
MECRPVALALPLRQTIRGDLIPISTWRHGRQSRWQHAWRGPFLMRWRLGSVALRRRDEHMQAGSVHPNAKWHMPFTLSHFAHALVGRKPLRVSAPTDCACTLLKR